MGTHKNLASLRVNLIPQLLKEALEKGVKCLKLTIKTPERLQ